jgi:MFS family permease
MEKINQSSTSTLASPSISMPSHTPVFIIHSAFSFVNNFSFFFIPIYFLQQGFSGREIGVLFMISLVMGLLSSFYIGILTDRVGARKCIHFGLILLVLFYLGLNQAKTFWFYLALFLVCGLGTNIVRVTVNAYYLKMIREERQGKQMGFFNFLYQFGMGIGILAGTFMLVRIGFRDVFTLSAFMVIPLIAVSFQLAPHALVFSPAKIYLDDLKETKTALFSLILFVFAFHWGVETTCYSPYLMQEMGLSTTVAGIFIALPIFLLALSTYYFGVYTDKSYSSLKLLKISMVLSGAGMVLFVSFKNIYWAFLFRLVHEIGDAAFTIFTFQGFSRLFSKERMGGNTGQMILLMILGQAIGSFIFSWIGGDYGYQLAHILAGFLTLSLLILVRFTEKHYMH